MIADNNFIRLINIALRGLTLASKFLLIFFLARFLEPAELGLYGLLVATISYSLYLVGFDFYTFSTREVIKSERGVWGRLLKSQLAFVVLLYFIFLPLLIFVFIKGLLPWRVAGWFFVILILEHFAQEQNRLLVAISKQLLASIVLFLRSGAWALAVIVIMFFNSGMRDIEFVLLAWSIGGVSACALSIWQINKLKVGGWNDAINWAWIRQGIWVAGPFLISTLALRGIFTLDRYWIEFLLGLNVVGAYVLFIGISNALVSFLDAAVFVFIYPGLINAYQSKKPADFRRGMRQLIGQSMIISIVFVALALVLIDPILLFLDKDLYIENKNMFVWILLAMLIFVMGALPQYGLYAQGKDRHIILSHVASLFVFIPVTYFITLAAPSVAIPLGLCCAFSVSFFWKSFIYIKETPKEYLSLKN